MLLTRQEVDERFPESQRCVHCGCWHDVACPRIKRIVFRGGEASAVEFWEWSPRDWDRWTSERNRAVTLTTRTQKESMIGGILAERFVTAESSE